MFKLESDLQEKIRNAIDPSIKLSCAEGSTVSGCFGCSNECVSSCSGGCKGSCSGGCKGSCSRVFGNS